MFQVLAPVVVHFAADARAALGAQLVPAGRAAWREIARRGQGMEFAHLPLCHGGIALAVCSRLRRDGVFVIEIGLGDTRHTGRVVPAAVLRRAEERAAGRWRR